MAPHFYLVGGAVRDILLGKEPKDRDYVVVGATPEWMVERGFTQVGASFPVFLHPETGEEYALARIERKVGVGYHGFETKFDSSVTLEEDLKRRDLTINSMAMDGDGNLIDPYNGKADLDTKVLRHTSEAFAEDPLRVLRVARFAARYEFEIHPDTIQLSRQLVDAGELQHLSRERIFNELMKGFSEKRHDLMVEALDLVGALRVEPLARYFSRFWKNDASIARLLKDPYPIDVAAVYMSHLSKEQGASKELQQKLCLPEELCLIIKIWTALFDHLFIEDGSYSPESTLKLITDHRMDTRLQEPSYQSAFQIAEAAKEHRLHFTQMWDIKKKFLLNAIEEVKRLDFEKLLEGVDKAKIKEFVKQAKLDAVKKVRHGF
jgi:tRNA nucleotidyltransferase/poly(A) polymerase